MTRCAACGTPASASSTRCATCGSAIEHERDADALAAMLAPSVAPPSDPTPPSSETPDESEPVVETKDEAAEEPEPVPDPAEETESLPDSPAAPSVSEVAASLVVTPEVSAGVVDDEPPQTGPIDEPIPAEEPTLGGESATVDGPAPPETAPEGSPDADEADQPRSRRLDSLRLTRQLVHAQGRADLVARIDELRLELQRAEARVIVVGEYKQGKSTMINALTSAEVCPVDDVAATAVPTLVRYADDHRAFVSDGSLDSASRREVELHEVAELILEDVGLRGERSHVPLVELTVPRRVLAGGLALVDTPGVGGLDSADASLTAALADRADGVVFVTDVTQELTATELEFLAEISDRCEGPTVCVVTKSDLSADPAAMVARNRRRLDGGGLQEVALIAVSAHLHLHALRNQDRQLERESGFAGLYETLHAGSFTSARDRLAGSARQELREIVAQLEIGVDAAQRAVDGDADAVARECRAASERQAAARRDGAQWKSRLNGGIEDLQRRATFERQRDRDAIRPWVDNYLGEESDVDEEQFFDALYKRVIDVSRQHYEWIQGEIDSLAAEVQDLYTAETADDLEFTIDTEFSPRTSPVLRARREQDTGRMRDVIAVAQGSTGGVVMGSTAMTVTSLGLNATSVASIGVLAPFAPILLGLPLGLMLARRTIGDDRRRRREAKTRELAATALQYRDTAWIDLTEESQNVIRHAAQSLRRHFDQRSRQTQRSLMNGSVLAERIGAQRAAGAVDQDEMRRELAQIKLALDRMTSSVSELLVDAKA